jgi:hypothetical protein
MSPISIFGVVFNLSRGTVPLVCGVGFGAWASPPAIFFVSAVNLAVGLLSANELELLASLVNFGALLDF